MNSVPHATDEVPEAQPLRGRRPDADARVEQDEPVDALWVPDGEPQPERAAPVVDDERRAPQVELESEALEGGVVAVVRVGLGPERLVRAPEPDQVGHDHAPDRERGSG